MQPSTHWSKLKPLLGADVNLTKVSEVIIFGNVPVVWNVTCEISFVVYSTQQGDVPFSDPEFFLTNKVITTSAVSTDMENTEMAFEFGDVTYKSLISAGGEVEIKDFSLPAEASLMLPNNQGMSNTCWAEDLDNSGSVIHQSCCADHKDHPYHNPETKDAPLVADKASEISTSSQEFGKLKDESVTEDFTNVTWRSRCDGGGVQISDLTTTKDEMIPMPPPLFSPHLGHSSFNKANLAVLSQQYNEEHADHPYCGTNHDAVPSISSGNGSGFQEPDIGVKDTTFKSFNCTGGEIQISDGTTLEDETAPLPPDQTSACSKSCIYGVDPSISTTLQDDHKVGQHLDHPYCHMKTDPSPLNDDCLLVQEALPDVLNSPEEAHSSSLVLPDDLIKNKACVEPVSLKSSGNYIEESDGVLFTHKNSARPENPVLIFSGLDYSNTNAPNEKDQNEGNYDRRSSKNSDVFNRERSELSKPSLPNESCTQSVHKFCNSPMVEKDTVLPSSQPKAELSGCGRGVTSAESLTPGEDNRKHITREQVDVGPHQISEAKDSAIGASTNAAGLCNSAEKPETEIISGVLKALSECPSVASALQLGQLSPVVRRASVFLLEAKKAPSVDQFLTDDSALEADKSLLANVNVNPAGLWAEQLMSPMPRPLFNSTAVGGKCQRSLVTEPVENVYQKPAVQSPVVDAPLIPNGPLQQQLRQMAEFLLLASGKISPGSTSAPFPPPIVPVVPKTQASPVGSHSVCVGTSPVKFIEQSINTSGQFERKRDFSVADTCTLTDPLLWK